MLNKFILIFYKKYKIILLCLFLGLIFIPLYFTVQEIYNGYQGFFVCFFSYLIVSILLQLKYSDKF